METLLLVPLAYRPPTQADSAAPMPPWIEATMMRLIGSDSLFWSALHVARDPVSSRWCSPPLPNCWRMPARKCGCGCGCGSIMLDNMVSLRTEGLRSDAALGKHLLPSPLASIHMSTLVISARDDQYGTDASAQYTAERIVGAKSIGFGDGSRTWVGHIDKVMAAVVELRLPSASHH